MKKIFICLSLITFVVSCKKEVENGNINSKNESIAYGNDKEDTDAGSNYDKNGNNVQFDAEFQMGNEGRFLIFRNERGYEKATENPSDEVRQNLKARLNNLAFQSWKDFSETDNDITNDDLIETKYFGEMLSKDRTIQIENHIYKINPQNEEVLALHVRDKEYYEDLVNDNKSNTRIRVFSTLDNVLELIKLPINGGNDIERGLGCSEGGVGRRSVQTSHSNGYSSTGVTTRLRHVLYGVFFAIETTSSSPGNLGYGYFKFIYSTNTDEKRFKPRCRDTQYCYNTSSIYGVSSLNQQTYFSTRNLSKYHIKVKCEYYAVDAFFQNPTLVSTSSWLTIRVNW